MSNPPGVDAKKEHIEVVLNIQIIANFAAVTVKRNQLLSHRHHLEDHHRDQILRELPGI